jgi:hypothetical protein
MTTKSETERADEGQPAQQPQTSRPKEPQGAGRIAALLRERFGIER